MTPLLLTKIAAAERLGVDPATIRRLVLRGEIATVAIGGDARIPEDELVAWVQRNKRVCLYDDARGEPASGRSTSGTSEAAGEISAAARRKRSSRKGGFVEALGGLDAAKRLLGYSTATGESTEAASEVPTANNRTSARGTMHSDQIPSYMR